MSKLVNYKSFATIGEYESSIRKDIEKGIFNQVQGDGISVYRKEVIRYANELIDDHLDTIRYIQTDNDPTISTTESAYSANIQRCVKLAIDRTKTKFFSKRIMDQFDNFEDADEDLMDIMDDAPLDQEFNRLASHYELIEVDPALLDKVDSSGSVLSLLEADVYAILSSFNIEPHVLIADLSYPTPISPEELKKWVQESVKRFSDCAIIISAHATTADIPELDSYESIIDLPEDLEKEFRDKLNERAEVFKECGFIDVSEYNPFEHSIPFVYGNDIGKKILEAYEAYQFDFDIDDDEDIIMENLDDETVENEE